MWPFRCISIDFGNKPILFSCLLQQHLWYDRMTCTIFVLFFFCVYVFLVNLWLSLFTRITWAFGRVLYYSFIVMFNAHKFCFFIWFILLLNGKLNLIVWFFSADKVTCLKQNVFIAIVIEFISLQYPNVVEFCDSKQN